MSRDILIRFMVNSWLKLEEIFKKKLKNIFFSSFCDTNYYIKFRINVEIYLYNGITHFNYFFEIVIY